MSESIYFNDNFFSTGQTEIYNSDKEKIGTLDLKSAFSASVDLFNEQGDLKVRGYFPVFSRKWNIVDSNEAEIGILQVRFSFFSKVYEYSANNKGIYNIESEAFSREYKITDQDKEPVCEFKKVNNFFTSPAFQLTDYTDEISTFEWVAVVMGVNAIEKRRRNSSAGAT